MNFHNNEVQYFSISLIPGSESKTFSDKKFDLKKKLEAIERLSLENNLLEGKLEQLRVRMEIECHPLTRKFCDARLFNLELLEDSMGHDCFSNKERIKIIDLITQGALEIWNLGDYRVAKYLKEYLPDESDIDETIRMHSFKFEPSEEDSEEEEIIQTPKDDTYLELKSLYHDLVKTLHPDKVQDEKAKAERNLLMKKVTEAYQDKDIYTLLKLVARYIGIGRVKESRMELYLKALNRKLKELKDQKLSLTRWGPLGFIYRTLYSRNPARVNRKIQNQLDLIRTHIKSEESFSDIYADDYYLKSFLKAC